jgi:hypothetical protein
VARERALHGDGARDRVPRARKRVEERVALRIDLGPAFVAQVLPQQPPVIADDAAVRVSELLQQPGGAFDVREQKGDGAAGERGHDAESKVAM